MVKVADKRFSILQAENVK